jgi:hypothetical protein
VLRNYMCDRGTHPGTVSKPCHDLVYILGAFNRL